MPLSKWMLPPLLALFSSLSIAADRPAQPCDNTTLQTLAKLLEQKNWHIPQYGSYTPLVAAACKNWPDNPAMKAVAVAYTEDGDQTPPGDRYIKLLVGQLNTSNGQLINRINSDISEDPALEIDSNSLWLDTARYHLALGIRGFGLVVRNVARGPSCPDFWSNDNFTLYAPQNGQLNEVFQTSLQTRVALKGELCSTSEPSIIEHAELTLSMGKGSHNGYSDLIVTSRLEKTVSGRTTDAVRTKKATARFNGSRYSF
jgi:hypothetical protein